MKMKPYSEEGDNRIKGVVTVLRVPRGQRTDSLRAAFIKFDSYTNLGGRVDDSLLNKHVYAVVRLSTEGAVLTEAVTPTEDGDYQLPSYDVNDKELHTIFGKLSKNEKGYNLKGATFRLESEEADLKRLKNKRVTAVGNFADFEVEEGDGFTAFIVNNYTILSKSNSLTVTSDDQEEETGLVDELLSCDLILSYSYPPTLLIVAKGKVWTGGYSEFHLSQYHYVTPPADGVYDFDFLCTYPDPNDEVDQEEHEKLVALDWPDFPQDLLGVRVRSKQNEIIEYIELEQEQNATASLRDSEAESGNPRGLRIVKPHKYVVNRYK